MATVTKIWSWTVGRMRRRGRGQTLESLARANAADGFDGPPEDEPHVQRMVQDLRADLTRTYRRDGRLRSGRTALQEATDRAAELRDLVPVVQAETEARVAAAAGLAPDAVETAAALWTDGAQALAARRRARRDLRAADQDVLRKTRQLDAIDGEVIDAVAEQAAAGLVPINAYLAAFNQERTYRGGAPIGILGDAWVHALARDALRPIELNEPEPRADADDVGDRVDPTLRIV